VFRESSGDIQARGVLGISCYYRTQPRHPPEELRITGLRQVEPPIGNLNGNLCVQKREIHIRPIPSRRIWTVAEDRDR